MSELREFLLETARKAAENTQSSLLDSFTRQRSQSYLFGKATDEFPDLDEELIRAEIQGLKRELSDDPEAKVAFEKPSRPPIRGREPIHDSKWDERLLALRMLIDVPMKTEELFEKARREWSWDKPFFQAAIAASEGRAILEYQPPFWMPAPKEDRQVTKPNRVKTRQIKKMIDCLLDQKSEVEIVQRQKEVNAKRGLLGAQIEDREREIRAKHRQELDAALGPLRADKRKLDKELQDLVDQLSEGKTTREVDCEERYDYETGVVVIVRLDTRDIVDRRPMARDERQLEMGDL